ncbi:Ltp family lipoprotein [Pseudarthrobacter sp. NPDC092184]|uniref:Ltp family lipoprotein n=1 Tax=Pseudarthrobacter TaxID=1742993 RepID=UPI0035EFF591|nr:hypothetical protein GCM10017547_35840 [Pseudarthrobacter oxydans]
MTFHFHAFSRTGLIMQLELHKFTPREAIWAADHVEMGWKEQAAKKAESYLTFQAFSRQGLVDQLTFDVFLPRKPNTA